MDKNQRLVILISIALIVTLILIIIVREDQHNEAIADRENKLEDELLQSIKNFTELEEMYLELKQENIELREKSDIIWGKFTVTAYTANDSQQGTNNIVATGFNIDCNLPIIATDPEVIPLYSIVEIKDMGAYISLDVGGVIKGNRIDILFSSKEEAIDFGIQEREVRVIK